MDLTYEFDKRTHQIICSPVNYAFAVKYKTKIMGWVRREMNLEKRPIEIVTEPACDADYMFILWYPDDGKTWDFYTLQIKDDGPPKKYQH